MAFGIASKLPKEMQLKILMFLCEDSIIVLSSASKECRSLSLEEDSLWREKCRSKFLPPVYPKACPEFLFQTRFNSFRDLFFKRQRVRTDGFYFCKSSYARRRAAPTMWDAVPPGVVLEATTFRYLRFFADGTVQYLMGPFWPHRVAPQFHSSSPFRNRLREGKYCIRKDSGLTVNVMRGEDTLITFNFDMNDAKSFDLKAHTLTDLKECNYMKSFSPWESGRSWKFATFEYDAKNKLRSWTV